jgi:hypothetical protein
MITGMGQSSWPDPKTGYPFVMPPYQMPPLIMHTPPYDSVAIPENDNDNKKMIIWYESFKKLIEAAKEFDESTGQPDCIDPKKEEWLNKVEERIKQAVTQVIKELKEEK